MPKETKVKLPRKAVTVTDVQPTEDVKVKGVADHVVKQGTRNNTLIAGEVRVGMSKGATLNMGNYQSARIDFWMERVVEDTQHAVNKAYSDMTIELDQLIEDEADAIGVKLG